MEIIINKNRLLANTIYRNIVTYPLLETMNNIVNLLHPWAVIL